MRLSEINDKISTVCPIFGVNSDGKIEFKPEATEEQKLIAKAIMDTDITKLVKE